MSENEAFESVRQNVERSLTQLVGYPVSEDAFQRAARYVEKTFSDFGITERFGVDGDNIYVLDIYDVELLIMVGKLEKDKTYHVYALQRQITHVADVTWNDGPYIKGGAMTWDMSIVQCRIHIDLVVTH